MCFVEKNLSTKECANLIAKYFSSISQEYEPINLQTLPERVKIKMQSEKQKVPHIEAYEVLLKFRSRKFKMSSVDGDVPPKLKREFQV